MFALKQKDLETTKGIFKWLSGAPCSGLAELCLEVVTEYVGMQPLKQGALKVFYGDVRATVRALQSIEEERGSFGTGDELTVHHEGKLVHFVQ